MAKTRFEDVLKIYESDKSLQPMMIHENYPSQIQKINGYSLVDKVNIAEKTIDAIIDGDIIDKIMYNVQGWHLQTNTWS